MVAVEVDGFQHRERPAVRDDGARQAALEAAGWTVIRIRSDNLTADLLRAIALVRAASVVPR